MKNAAVKSRLVVRFTALLTAVLFVSVGVYCIWSITDQRDASERKVLQEARLLAREMQRLMKQVYRLSERTPLTHCQTAWKTGLSLGLPSTIPLWRALMA